MKAIDFVRTYLGAARQSETETGVNAIFSLAQAALESGWGDKAPGYAFFGIKDSDGLNGNEQLIPTTEYSSRGNLTARQVGLNSIDSIHFHPELGSHGLYLYIGKGWFRKYDSPAESFKDHGKLFFKRNGLGVQPYGAALPFLKDPEKFTQVIAPIYASGPAYADLIIKIMNSIKKIIQQYQL